MTHECTPVQLNLDVGIIKHMPEVFCLNSSAYTAPGKKFELQNLISWACPIWFNRICNFIFFKIAAGTQEPFFFLQAATSVTVRLIWGYTNGFRTEENQFQRFLAKNKTLLHFLRDSFLSSRGNQQKGKLMQSLLFQPEASITFSKCFFYLKKLAYHN